MSRTHTRLIGAALATTLALFATACGSDDDSADDTTTTQDETNSNERAEEDDTAADAGDKPSQDEVIAGYNEIVADMVGELPTGVVNEVVTCFVEEVYDDASPQTLQAIADANVAGIDQNDAQLFADATTACQSSLTP